MSVRTPKIVALLAGLCVLWGAVAAKGADELTAEKVLRSIERGVKYLDAAQNADGSWTVETGDRYKIGVTSLTLLALLNAGETLDDPAVQKGLAFLRDLDVNDPTDPQPEYNYEVALMIMALAAAKDGQRDMPRLMALTRRLEKSQITTRARGTIGAWSYKASPSGLLGVDLKGDNSNTQYAILGLKEASDAGVPVDHDVWKRARDHWHKCQNLDGGWGYSASFNAHSTGSMTVAGIASLVICNGMLRDDKDLTRDGRPACCGERETDEQLARGIEWLSRHFSVKSNPHSPQYVLYYLYGLERAGRLSGRRFFGENVDWYRLGAEYLILHQNGRGYWKGEGSGEQDPVIGTSLALLFLSKGLSPVLINKLDYSLPAENWNQHPDDVRNLTEFVSGLDKWPRLVTWQTLELDRVLANGSVQDVRQAPVLYLSGAEAPQLSDAAVALLREYIDQGGFIFAVRNCNAVGFDQGFRQFIARMFPNDEARLARLTDDHIVFRSQYPLDAKDVELWGVDVGCRTAIIYSPDDISCYWDKWMRHDPPRRNAQLKQGIERAMKIGVNVVAYATGREPPVKLDIKNLPTDSDREDQIERGLLQIAKLRHGGGWDTAPHALRNLLVALNRTGTLAASTNVRSLPPADPNLYKYPVLYMHGRSQFSMTDEEIERLRTYLENGGLLFSDACCGDRQYDAAFRDFVRRLFPDQKLERIPVTHELFTGLDGFGYDIRKVRRRAPESDGPGVALNLKEATVEPYLEGIQLKDRWAVIYSKYDISCALERQASVACAGYIPEDALKIGVNVILYSMLQDARYDDWLR